MNHDDLRDLIAAVALGAATPDEEHLVNEHIRECRECREVFDGLNAAVGGLAVSVPQLDPPSSLKASLMEIVGREAAERPGRTADVRRGRSRWLPSRATMWPSLAAGIAALAVGLAVWGGVFRGPDGPVTRTVPVVAATASGTAEIRDGEAILRLTGLPQTPPGRGYQVWVIRAGQEPVSAGFMARSADGGLVGVAEDVEGARLLAVTAEALSNTRAPTSTPLVTVPLAGA